MIIQLLLLIVGLILLVFGSDQFVNAGSKIAKKFGVSEFVIGLTLIAVGTSLPELASSIMSALAGSSELIVGNLMGSNIANIGLIVGFSAILAVITAKEVMLKRDGYIMIFIFIIFTLLALNGQINFIEGLILILLYLIYALYLIESKEEIKVKFHFRAFLRYILQLGFFRTAISKLFSKSKQKKIEREGLVREIIMAIASLAALILGAKLLVNYSIYFAQTLGLSETLIGLLLIAVGTSLPELAVSISAVRKGFNEILIGNIIGSNIVNISLIFGISALITPIKIAASSLYYLVPAMLFFAILFLIFIRFNLKIKCWQGILLLGLYIIFIIFAALKRI